MTAEQLIALLPESIGVLAIIIVVMLFHRYQSSQDVRLNKISERCHDTQVEIQRGYQDSLKVITEAHLASSLDVRERLSSVEHNISDLVAAINQMVGKMQ